MKYKYLLLMSTLIMFFGCVKGNHTNTVLNTKHELKSNHSPKHDAQTVTIYVHGFKPDGYERELIYGNEYRSDFTRKLQKFTGFPSLSTYNKNNFKNLIVGVEYYGSESPTYYNRADRYDISQVEEGIPRYSLVVAKFIKHTMKETGATKVNIVSVSMGSLITRYLIEKNLENIAADQKIEKWLTAEGILRGNYALSRMDKITSRLIKNIINLFFKQSPERQQMKYKWIEKNLTSNREELNSPYYKNILFGQISLTDSMKSIGIGLRYILPTDGGINLKYTLATGGGFQPNDGYQLLKDTYCTKVNSDIQVPSHTLIHTDHIGINTNDSVFSIITAFLEAKKRVKITLVDAKINNLHETIIPILNEKAEIVFTSQIFSMEAQNKFSMTAPISERNYDSGALKIHYFRKKSKKKRIRQILFDDFVLSSENRVQIKLEGYEIDRSLKYKIEELKINDNKESIGTANASIPLVNGVYEVISDDWSGHIKVEVVNMK